MVLLFGCEIVANLFLFGSLMKEPKKNKIKKIRPSRSEYYREWRAKKAAERIKKKDLLYNMQELKSKVEMMPGMIQGSMLSLIEEIITETVTKIIAAEFDKRLSPQ